ncbi:Signal transduction histidine kinase [Marininema mesophilum]|uniref:histidine kinase n=1 Tax=Marininema mesophilum TaxID=1048340 RepID=A0A1H2QWE7_9BACL|nr:sensor histidine kinase [Marininema mesophilum]SDW11497.1 Signal transduction histidine kinase [Marininema mesophilum]
MRLFLRDHMVYIIVYLIQMILVPLLYWLGGYGTTSLGLYAILLSSTLLLAYLCYRYIRLRSFYQRLSQPLETLDESIQKVGYAPLADALDQLLQTQFQHYQNQLHHFQHRLEDHVIFINQWVHQMKTSISVIQLTIQEEDDPIFHSIQEEIDRLRKGLEMVLYISRLDQFEYDFHVELISIHQVVKKVVSNNKRLFIYNQVYPEIQVDEQIHVYSDEKWLSFMIDQLITNAVRYSVGESQKVIISCSVLHDQAVLEVKDYGIGIPKQDIRRVFEPYFTGKHGREYSESTGMGLYLVREISNRLHHRVELESEVGVGTSVRLVFQPFMSQIPPGQ